MPYRTIRSVSCLQIPRDRIKIRLNLRGQQFPFSHDCIQHKTSWHLTWHLCVCVMLSLGNHVSVVDLWIIQVTPATFVGGWWNIFLLNYFRKLFIIRKSYIIFSIFIISIAWNIKQNFIKTWYASKGRKYYVILHNDNEFISA